MVDHWINNQRVQSGTSSPVQDAESVSPSPAKKNLKIQTTVTKDKPRTIGSQKTLSQRYVAFYFRVRAVHFKHFNNYIDAVSLSSVDLGNSHSFALFRHSRNSGIRR